MCIRDRLWGILLGWQQLLRAGRIPRLPRLHAVEPYARLSRARGAGDARGLWEGTTDQYSIAGGTVTLQSLEALARSGGSPVEVTDAAAAQAQQRLERLGLATELSSAAALAAVTRLRRAGQLDAESSVVDVYKRQELTRTLGNLPGNLCTPTYLGETAKRLAREYKSLKVEVMDRKQVEALGMGSFLSVARGSEEALRFICLLYTS